MQKQFERDRVVIRALDLAVNPTLICCHCTAINGRRTNRLTCSSLAVPLSDFIASMAAGSSGLAQPCSLVRSYRSSLPLSVACAARRLTVATNILERSTRRRPVDVATRLQQMARRRGRDTSWQKIKLRSLPRHEPCRPRYQQSLTRMKYL
jgi:hypothetical protein